MKNFIVLLSTATKCKICDKLLNNLPEIKKQLPNIEFIIYNNESMLTLNVNTNNYPKGVIEYTDFFPMILLIPQKTWDDAKNNKTFLLRDGVIIMNTERNENSKFIYKNKVNILNIDEFVNWVKENISK